MSHRHLITPDQRNSAAARPGRRENEVAPRKSRAPSPPPRLKIAIIEDSDFMRKVTAMTVMRLCPDAELFEYADAGEALKALGKIAPDVITLDLLMPGIGGLEFLKQARRRKFAARIIVVTADVQAVVRQRCLDAGAHAFVEKPITLAKLRAALAEIAPDAA